MKKIILTCDREGCDVQEVARAGQPWPMLTLSIPTADGDRTIQKHFCCVSCAGQWCAAEAVTQG